MLNNNPTVDELVAEGVPRDVAVLIRPYLKVWSSDVGDLARAIRKVITNS
ncbi:hypothetical protein [Mycobacterium avium]|nr:hypothetical protein [Mycobacterium avium]